jgi:hypothetical protein
MSADRDFVAQRLPIFLHEILSELNTQNVKSQMAPAITFVRIIRQDVLEKYFVVMLTNLLALVCLLHMLSKELKRRGWRCQQIQSL